MTGPAHYTAAERCLSSVDDDGPQSLALLAEAQVHATLALAAATALVTPEPSDERIAIDPIVAEWWRVAS